MKHPAPKRPATAPEPAPEVQGAVQQVHGFQAPVSPEASGLEASEHGPVVDLEAQGGARLDPVLSALKALPCADELWVFGSMAKGASNPGDVDVFLNRRTQVWAEFSASSEATDLLRVAREFYGGLDPFVLLASDRDPSQKLLIVRNDRATGWQAAHKAREISQAITRDRVRLSDLRPDLQAASTPPREPES